MMKTIILYGLLAGTTVFPLAHAETNKSGSSSGQSDPMSQGQTSTQYTEQSFTAADADGDGNLTEEEARNTVFEQNFSNLDADDDGEIDRNEIMMKHGQPTGAGGSGTGTNRGSGTTGGSGSGTTGGSGGSSGQSGSSPYGSPSERKMDD